MMSPFSSDSGASTVFAASQIARAAGWSKRRVLSGLAGISASGKITVAGNAAAAWCFTALPFGWRQHLARTARQRGYRNAEALLSDPAERWQPSLALSKIDLGDVAYAGKLQTALKEYLTARCDVGSDLAASKERAAAKYCQAFTVATVSARQIERLAEMVTERDHGFEEWERVEIYLPLRYRSARSQATSRVATDGGTLSAAISSVADPACPTPADRAMVWRAAVETVLEQTAGGENLQAVKRIVRDQLIRFAPWMGSSSESLKKGLNEKLAVAERDGLAAIRDRRAEASGNFRRPDFSEDRLLLAKIAHAHEGNIGLAHRLLHRGWTDPADGKTHHFSDEYRGYISPNLRRDKSYVPAFMREDVRPLVASIAPYKFGPHAAKMARPSRLRDWSEVGVNDWHTSDDETANSIVFWPAPNGEYECEWGRFNIGRPQILPLYDVASEMPLALSVTPAKGYSADTIRDLVTPAWLNSQIGMPFQGCYFERGIWESKNVEALTNWALIDGAFKDQGISMRIRHATTPRAKTIERVFGGEQNRTCAFPGYVGRGRKGEQYERVHRFLGTLKRAGQPRKEMVDPREKLWGLDQFARELEIVMREIAAEPQNGERFRGRSPEEMWNESVNLSTARPVLPHSLEYLLSTKQTELTVSTNGLFLKIGGSKFQFCESERLGLLIGEKVSVRYSGRIPDHIIVTDPLRDPRALDPFVIPCRGRLAAMSAERADFNRAREEEDTRWANGTAVCCVRSP